MHRKPQLPKLGAITQVVTAQMSINKMDAQWKTTQQWKEHIYANRQHSWTSPTR